VAEHRAAIRRRGGRAEGRDDAPPELCFVMMYCMRRKCASMSPKMNLMGASHGEYGGRAKGRWPAWIITWSARGVTCALRLSIMNARLGPHAGSKSSSK
jgi:hypothetical protein